MPHKPIGSIYPAPPFGDCEFPPRISSLLSDSYEDLFKGLDTQLVLTGPLQHPGTGEALTPTSSIPSRCPTFRHQPPRSPGKPPSSSQSTTLPPRSPQPITSSSPHGALKPSYSTSAITTTSLHGSIYSPSRSFSTKSNLTSLTSSTASRSDSGASRRSPRPEPCALPPQPGRHNSLAELHARQANIPHVQQPISPYAEVLNPLEKIGYAVSGIARRKSSGVELRDRNEAERGLKKKKSFARLGWGHKSGNLGDSRRGSEPAVDVSKNF
ncbi:unnamed protein product [Periconia digitata]|uniref:Uncharacterized protein n=1 Tax=Periconia digitata TaxID=1303443 RepID=A0A9W4U5U2_9PLEO|nr:unnamed protein product [Periconia digitata]